MGGGRAGDEHFHPYSVARFRAVLRTIPWCSRFMRPVLDPKHAIKERDGCMEVSYDTRDHSKNIPGQHIA